MSLAGNPLALELPPLLPWLTGRRSNHLSKGFQAGRSKLSLFHRAGQLTDFEGLIAKAVSVF